MKNGLIVDEYGATKFWYKDDQWHREDGPAIEFTDGSKYWYFNGKRHREDGPALEFADGRKVWCYYDKVIGNSDLGMTNEKFLKIIKLKLFW